MIKVENVTMEFDLNRGKVRSLKEKLLTKTSDLVKKDLFRALSDVSFEVNKGDVFGIVGPNGAGKSTLLKIIAGIMKPSSGKVRVAGTIAPMIELGAGFDYELSAEENIYLCGAVLGYNPSFLRKHIVEIVEFADLWDFRDVPIKYYSSGMIARLAFSVSTIVVPDVLIVDEILSVGDQDFQRKSFRRMLDLIQGGSTVVFVSHDMKAVRSLCTRGMWLKKGKVESIGEIDAVVDAYEGMFQHG